MRKRAEDHRKEHAKQNEGKIYGILCSGISLREDDTGASAICSDSWGKLLHRQTDGNRGTSSPALRTDVLFRIYELI